MPIYTKTTFIHDNAQPPNGNMGTLLTEYPGLANHLLQVVELGYTSFKATLVIEPGEEEYSIMREWSDLDQANIWAELSTDSLTVAPGFISCTVITE